MASTTKGRAFCLIPHPTDRAIAVVIRRRAWTLPHVDCPDGVVREDPLRQRLRDRFGVDAVVLRRLWASDNGDAHASPEAYLMDALTVGDRVSARGALRWVAPEQLRAHRVEPPETRAWLDEWLTPREPSPANNGPWTGAGWHAKAERDVVETLRVREHAQLLRLTQAKTSPRVIVLRCETTLGTRYLKAVLPSAWRELVATATLATLFPEHIPPVVEADVKRAWMLLRESAGRTLLETDGIETWKRALRAYACLQRGSIPHRSALVAAGWMERPVERWCSPAHDDLSAVISLYSALAGGPALDIDRIRPRLAEQAAALSALGVPLTVHHGDLNPANIIIGDTRCVFLDWDNACIGHPFCSVVELIYYFKYFRPALREAVPALVGAYLSEWSGYPSESGAPLSAEQLQLALMHVHPFAVLEYAAPVAQEWVNGMPDRHVAGEMRQFLTASLGSVLLESDRPVGVSP